MSGTHVILKYENVEIVKMHGGDPSHRGPVRRFLRHEADIFGETISNEAFERLDQVVKDDKVQVLLAYVEDEVVGCAAQGPGVRPKYNADYDCWDWEPIVYSEDMAVSKQASRAFAALHNIGLGTPFMKGRIELAAGVNHSQFDLTHNFAAGALLGEQSWPEDSTASTMLNRFNTAQAKSRDDCVLVFDHALAQPKPNFEAQTTVYSLLFRAGREGIFEADGMFGTEWRGNHSERIGASSFLAWSTFKGEFVMRMIATDNDKYPGNGGVKSALQSIMSASVAEVDELKLITNADIITRYRVHALGKPRLVDSFKAIGARNRVLGNYLMYPLSMDFKDIPESMGLSLNAVKPFIPSIRPRKSTRPVIAAVRAAHEVVDANVQAGSEPLAVVANLSPDRTEVAEPAGSGGEILKSLNAG